MEVLECCCQICGISFNISRIRHRGEPPESAWSGDQQERDYRQASGSFVHERQGWRDECHSCVVAARTPTSDEDERDTDFIYGSDQDLEPFEWASEAGSDCDSASEAVFQAVNSAATTRESFHPRSSMTIGPSWEHIAAKNCTCKAGYNGHRISIEEMRACTTAQFLVPRQALEPYRQEQFNWQPKSDNQHFQTGDFFLSGLTDQPARTNPRNSHIAFPDLADCAPLEIPILLQPDNVMLTPEAVGEVSMPFHPFCLEVYKRACLRRFGHVDMKSLTDWFRLEANPRHWMDQFPRQDAIRRGKADWWCHVTGDEWLAANPCFIPILSSVLTSFNLQHDLPLDEYELPRLSCNLQIGQHPHTSNLFPNLPLEILLEILSHVHGNDIISLCRTSRSFRRIPQSFFRNLVLKETPWLWEAWSTMPLKYAEWDRKHSDIESWRIPALIQESGPTGENMSAVAALRAELATIDGDMVEYRKPYQPIVLSETETDWRRLYTFVTKSLHSVHGLRNRARIWADCEHILDRIEMHRADGRIEDGIEVDPAIVSEAYSAAYLSP
ncbi:hypothetical protein EDB81DRAFT_864337 [Dactylonectria macrodidyma]|uniref:F-box domain-containing protein n=1 Tax=Dactylonectria macrodidyma TaxID=307937 RepID=A0A9P9JP83_9HYPO|nr:hypothetical protein EDB81DRAFT_864337 [Dactylonectria macrodidyma]